MTNVRELQRVLADVHRQAHAKLKDGEELITTFFLPDREFRIAVSMFSSDTAGLLMIFGQGEDGTSTQWIVPAEGVSCKIETVSTGKGRRVGFAPDFSSKPPS